MSKRWLDRSQPQTLYIATILLYINAAIGLIGIFLPLFGINFVGAVIAFVELFAGLGVANDRRSGFITAVIISIVNLFTVILSMTGIYYVSGAGSFISLIFAIALIALLLHPMSQNYQRVWFK